MSSSNDQDNENSSGKTANRQAGKAPSTGFSPSNMNPPLGAVVTSRTAGHLTGINVTRRYTGSLSTVADMLGNKDVDSKTIVYEISRRFGSNTTCFTVPGDMETSWQQTVRTNQVIKAELADRHKKWTNFTGVFEHMDLSALGFTLAVALAKYTYTGTLTCTEIRAGAEIAIRSITTRADPVSAATAAVYIPRSAAIDSALGSFAAMAAAANAWGATVLTDVLEVDGNNAVVVMEPAGADLAMGCVYGLRILLSMYDDCGYGPVMAYAVTRGVHHGLTVVGHTDEGGITRDALRRGWFCAPYGGIYTEGVLGYVGLPIPHSTSNSSFRSVVDSILLATAAVAAVSDPLTIIDSRAYPSVFTSRVTRHAEAGASVAATVQDEADLAQQLATACGSFCDNYVVALGILFGVTGEGVSSSVHLQTSFGSLAADISNRASLAKDPEAVVNRHFHMVTLAPYFWIEPTSLLRGHFGEFDAVKQGYAQVCDVGEEVARPMFEFFTATESRGFHHETAHSWRTARTNALIIHLSCHQKDGLASLIPRQFIKDKVHLPGKVVGVEAARRDNTDVAGYMWGRGQSPIPAPSEFMYLGKSMGSMLITRVPNDDFFVNESTHFPTVEEIKTGTVKLTCRAPLEVAPGFANVWDRAIRRSRGNAATALTEARNLLSRGVYSGGSEFIVGDFEPHVLDNPTEAIIEIGDFIIKSMPGVNQHTVITSTSSKMSYVYHDSALRPKGPQAKGADQKQKVKKDKTGTAKQLTDAARLALNALLPDALKEAAETEDSEEADGGEGSGPSAPAAT